MLEPYWIFSQTGATHGAPFGYNTHVPAIFMGPGIAPTLASVLDVETPSGSVGRVLSKVGRTPWTRSSPRQIGIV
jgi:hypothetical protein